MHSSIPVRGEVLHASSPALRGEFDFQDDIGSVNLDSQRIAALRRHAQDTASSWVDAGRQGGKVLKPEHKRLHALLASHALTGGLFDAETRAWLLENYRLIRTALRDAGRPDRDMAEHPHVSSAGGTPVPRVYALVRSFLTSVDFVYRPDALAVYVGAVQDERPLEMGEIWALKPMLQLVLLRELAATLERGINADSASGEAGIPAAGRLISSLRAVAQTDWKSLFEQVSLVERILRSDPSLTYPRMDYESRDMYRNAIAEMATHSRAPETEIAATAVRLAKSAAEEDAPTSRIHERHSHVGFYLVDLGLPALQREIGYVPPFARRIRNAILNSPNGFYLIGVELSTMLIAFLLLSQLETFTPIVAGFLLLITPATQAAVDFMNSLTTFLLKPRALPKLDFSEGIPDEFRTMVAVPTLLLNEQQVEETVSELEIRYLGNSDRNLYYALLTDAPDSDQPFDEKEELADFCSELIRGLNRKYGDGGAGRFYLFHRHRVFNPSEGAWMGWERKRGKLLDLNKLLRNDFDSFPVKVGAMQILPSIEFVITLDSDTQLPRDSAHKMVGTLAHPLNRAIIDPVTNTVVAGYGILQPRMGISVQSAGRSRLAALYSGQTGFDIYTRAVSDVYQDLYGEGIFTGKGIYDVDTLRAVLDHRFPCNALLSHDLIEGAYARSALVSDIELIDDYPSHFSAYSRRKHRWVRGDWQIAQWLFPRVPDYDRNSVSNPVTLASRWKILDNLRRSVIDPATFTLFLTGWFYLPGKPWYWTAATLALMLMPVYTQLLFSLLRFGDLRRIVPFVKETGLAFLKGHFHVLLNLVFLAHQTLVMLDAIIRTIVRNRFTHRRLLQWETAAQAEAGMKRRTPVDRYLSWIPYVSLLIAGLMALFKPESLPFAGPILALWFASPFISYWLNRAPRVRQPKLSQDDEKFLRLTALRTWRYFRQFSGPESNWLVPDNVQENPQVIAHRISPTNLGLLLNARQAAVEMGFLTVPELVRDSERTLASMRRMSRLRGHFLNWYDTRTLEPLKPLFLSTVDSGNLAACLWTLKQGCLSLKNRPLLPASLWQGLREHIQILDEVAPSGVPGLRAHVSSLGSGALEWIRELDELERGACVLERELEESPEAAWWAHELCERVRSIRSVVERFAPWLLAPAGELVEVLDAGPVDNLTLDNLAGRVRAIRCHLEERERFQSLSGAGERFLAALRSSVPRTVQEADALLKALSEIAEQAESLVRGMDFRFFYHPRKKLLSVGFKAGEGRLMNSYYDLMASEARIAAFVAIAKGDIPQESWFHLGRAHTLYGGERILLSWTGTMFEYLMPALWMRAYPATLMWKSMVSAVEAQQKYVRGKGIPWGISESAYSRTDAGGNYQYHAFGLSGLALKFSSQEALVVSPYSTFLALLTHASSAVRNLRDMAARSWCGPLGFYEAIDFTSVSSGQAVPCWMAHHQGMSLLAVCNLVSKYPFRQFFHAEPRVMATELLLQEMAPAVPIVHDDLETEIVAAAGVPAPAAEPAG
ncbi:MAG: hypothetical protein LC130_07945 [Bryobacterales bacterium]|nr:hypothetical protein [Bryobacterales bacterium]